ncbi:MAG TPA: hypothetical protein VLT45_29995 [Kofleriaceae bacterium]|nr:hypothetical protein [Kofleriaceae bacterium]
MVALCTSAQLRSWIEAEVGDLVSERLYAPDVGELVKLLSRGGASRSELLVLDLDLLPGPYTVGLKLALEDHWWNGTIVGIGTPREIHQRYLTLERTISRPLGSEALRACMEYREGDDTHPFVSWPDGLARRRSRLG